MTPYPLLFGPILKEKVWGGSELARLGKSLAPDSSIGESWELADLPDDIPDGRSVIANGPLQGMTLRECIAADRDAMLGAASLTAEGGFPLLIKYLDARENLSVQVHPSPAYAAAHSDARTKDEAWVILAADPGAKVYIGLKPGLTREALEGHLAQGTVIEALNAVPATPGRCYTIASGTVHALGKGIVLAEIQTPSDTTFRLYDWGRTGRDMHIEQALQCIDLSTSATTGEESPHPVENDAFRTTMLAETPHFAVERIESLGEASLEIETSGMPEVWMLVSGTCRIQLAQQPILTVQTGRTVLMPAALTDARALIERGATVLRITLPSPLKGMIA